MDNTQERKKILFISSEMRPFLDGDTPLAEIARYLPQKIQEKDNEVRILVPRFGVINERRNRLHEVVRLSGMNITIDDNDNPLTIKVASIPNTKMQVYFLDNEDFFHRKFIYNDENEEFFADNDERTIFFCKGALETVKKLGWYPDIIHCQGWMTSLIPLYLKTLYKDEPVFSNAKVIYSVYENDFKEDLGQDFMRKASLNFIEDEELEPFSKADCTSLHMGGIQHADAVVRCSDIDAEVEQRLSSFEKPILNHTNDEIADNYLNFYNSLLAGKQ
ncbi:MAG TPA: starch synthase [Bacteroidetes bacterium]|nr:starch synthase [Bacteroidota bacterium]